MEAISVEEKISAESLLAETAGRHLGDTVTLACIDMGTSQAAERFMKFSAGKLSLAYLVGKAGYYCCAVMNSRQVYPGEQYSRLQQKKQQQCLACTDVPGS